ncbi:MAG: hypothetical protein ACRDTJ_13130 [Pseudonocardiaceae bacterium]
MNGQAELASFMVDEVEYPPLSEGVFHLISAHEVVPNWRLYPVYVALCGEMVETANLAETRNSSVSAGADPPRARQHLEATTRGARAVRSAVDLGRVTQRTWHNRHGKRSVSSARLAVSRMWNRLASRRC